MHASITRRAAAIAVLATAAFTGCSDPAGNDEHDEPDIAAVTVSSPTGGTVTVPLSGNQSGTLTLRANQANVLTVNVLGVNGSADPVIVEHAADFEIRLVQNQVLRATSSNATHPYTISVTPTATGTAAYELQVYSTEHGHQEFARPLTVTVVQ